MKKFILLSFGFLGWAFYEMSGGADFEPASARAARLGPAPEVIEVAQEPKAEPAVTQAALALVDEEPTTQVTRVALNLTSVQDAVETEEATALTEAETDGGRVPVTDPTLTDSASTPAIIPSLIAPDDGEVVQSASLSSSASDVREVTGNRVNVRGGPGTSFGVVSKLVRGDAVEIIEDNGDGWVLMRPLSGGPEGWMADFLLTAG